MYPEDTGEKGFTIRALIIAVIISIFLLTASSYIALRLGALPWPIIFSVIVSGIILKAMPFKKTNPHEINVTQAGGTIGGLMASAVVFTLPGIIYLSKFEKININLPSMWVLILISLAGGITGILLSIPLRRTFVDKEQLIYPSGTAGAEVIKSGIYGGNTWFLLFLIGILSLLFALIRDLFFAQGYTFAFLIPLGIMFTLYPMPMGIGVGYILGPKISVNSWFSGSVIGWMIIIPLLKFKFPFIHGIKFVQELGMGIVLGAGVGFFVSYIIPRIKKIFAPLFKWKNTPWYMKFTPYISILSFIVLIFAGVPVLASMIGIIGVWIMTTVAARMTGETNIDPLEQFGIIVGLITIWIYALFKMKIGYVSIFLIVFFVSTAAALAGDIGHDYKSAKLLNTRAKDIIKVDIIAAIVVAILAPFVLKIIINGYGDIMFTPAMPAPQAVLVARSIFGFTYPYVFLIGFSFAFILEVLIRLTKNKKLPISLMALGIGMFLGLTLGFLLAIGGFIRWLTNRKKISPNKGVIISAGMMGGEGIAGFLSAFLMVIGINHFTGNSILLIIFSFILFSVTFIYFIKREKN